MDFNGLISSFHTFRSAPLPFLWNQLPLHVKEGNSTTVFKYRLKINFFTQYRSSLFHLFCKVY